MDFFKGSDLRFNLKNSYKKIVAVMVQFGSMLKAYFFRVLEKIQAFKNYLKDLFFSFPLRRKLSIIIGGVVFIVIVVLSLIFQQTEKGLLESKLEEICNLTVQYLSSYDIKDNLLMRNHDEIKLSVLYVKQKNITGLDYAWVINRDGQCIAHTNIKLTEGNQNLFTEEESNFLLGLKETTAIENATHYEYYYPIFATSKDA
ncbi:MAG: hypothetical protein SCK70_07805, partial [bacterium]|nr:hypothetical protein [bacterium]